MPVLIPLAINIGFYIEYLLREFKTLKSKKETILVYFQFGLIGLICLLCWVAVFFITPELKGLVLIRFFVLSLILIIVGAFIFKHLKSKSIKPVFYLIILFMLSLGFLGLPLSKTQIQSNYKPISSIKHKNLPLYTLGYVAPEVIYNYGNKIPDVVKSEGFLVPEEPEFYLLSVNKNPKAIKAYNLHFNIEQIDTFDLNFADKDAKSYKSRLTNKLYKLTRI